MTKGKKKYKTPQTKPDPSTQDTAPNANAHVQITNFITITTAKASLLIAILGIVVYFGGLSSPFIEDDLTQIVNNPVVQSVSHIPLLFAGGTFYNGQGITPLSGSFYRPLMMTVFSILYSVFGANPLPFHLLQLTLQIVNAILLYIVLRHFFRPAISLVLALVFLVHPINSQAVFSISALQEPLFFLFGITAVWLLLKYKSIKSMALVAVCLFLSMLSKETGLLFVAISAMYLIVYDRKRLSLFCGMIALPLILYAALRLHAVGLFKNSLNAPIDTLSLLGRIATMPSILTFYLVKFLFPLNLAQYYYWVYPSPTFMHFLVPLALVAAVGIIIGYLGKQIRAKLPKPAYMAYVFFTAWLVIGLLLNLQLIPLDATASETWFYFPIVGALGMIGVLIEAFLPEINPRWIITMVSIVIVLLGVRTFTRGLEWENPTNLAYSDLAGSKEDYNADLAIANQLTSQGDMVGAKSYAESAVRTFPTANTYGTLGTTLLVAGQYNQAGSAFSSAIKYNQWYAYYEDAAETKLWTNDPYASRLFIESALGKFPQDGKLWLYLAILEDMHGDNSDAQVAITNAYKYGVNDSYYYNGIMNNQPLTLPSHPGLGQ